MAIISKASLLLAILGFTIAPVLSEEQKDASKKSGAAETKAEASRTKALEKDVHPKQETKKEKPKSGFFGNVSKFFRNKGGS